MYALQNKTQNKLIAKVRGGISQKIDNLNINQISNSSTLGNNNSKQSFTCNKNSLNGQLDDISASLPKPVFHTSTHPSNGRKSFIHRTHKQNITPDHHEMIKYVQQTWKTVEKNFERSSNHSDHINNNSTHQMNNNSINNTNNSARNNNANKRTSSLLLSGTYYHSSTTINPNNALPNFIPFDLETFWGNRIMKRLTEE